ncbi:MAG: hypothetical protein HGB00_02375 [Chlorobiaceae bacterium]|nr:hypothetical protein [Chlorobiaceae bacterium]
MLRTKEDWQQYVESGMPPPERYSGRNRAITAKYAGWYLSYPEIFKWSGMASFASRQVGVAIVLVEMLAAPDRMGAENPLAGLHRFASQQFMQQDLEEIRKGNNKIFRDIAWAHAAYIEGGLAEIEACADEADRRLLLDGFSAIDRGAGLLRTNPDSEEGRRLVWEGNIALLRHEQTEVLQPVFDMLTSGGRIIASFGSELDFSCSLSPDPKFLASFSSHYGYLETLAGLKCIADPVDRWQWVESCVIPAWMAADQANSEGSSGKEQLVSMAAGEQGLLHKISSFTGGLLPG